MTKRSTLLGEHLRARDKQANEEELAAVQWWGWWWGKLLLLTLVPLCCMAAMLTALATLAKFLAGK